MEPFDYLSGEDENVNDYCCDDKEDVDDDDESNDDDDGHEWGAVATRGVAAIIAAD